MNTQYPTHTAQSKPQNAPQAFFEFAVGQRGGKNTEILCKTGRSNSLRLGGEKDKQNGRVEHQLVAPKQKQNQHLFPSQTRQV